MWNHKVVSQNELYTNYSFIISIKKRTEHIRQGGVGLEYPASRHSALSFHFISVRVTRKAWGNNAPKY